MTNDAGLNAVVCVTMFNVQAYEYSLGPDLAPYMVGFNPWHFVRTPHTPLSNRPCAPVPSRNIYCAQWGSTRGSVYVNTCPHVTIPWLLLPHAAYVWL